MNSHTFKDFCKACDVSIRMRQATKEELSELQKDKAFNFWHDFNDDTVDDLLVRQADLACLKFYLGKLGCAVEIKNLKNDRHCLLYVDSGFWIRRIDFPFQKILRNEKVITQQHSSECCAIIGILTT